MTDSCSITKFPREWGFRREPRRPIELRRDYFGGMKFNDNFDWDNIWYDAVQIAPQAILLIGPPLYGAANSIASLVQITDPQGNLLNGSFIEMDRACLTVINSTQTVDHIKMLSNTGEVIIKVNQASSEFDNRKTMFTLQKDNPISWIREWMAYHQMNLGVDASLIYDNSSTSYSAESLEEQLRSPGVVVRVVRWDVPYGPQGFDCDYYNTWDSDYAQSTMFEHAKRRYLHDAAIAINADIDELLVLRTRTLDQVIADIHVSNLAGYSYKGVWIEPYDLATRKDAHQLPMAERHFYHYHCTDVTQPRALGNKWMLVPGKALDSQWLVHHTGCRMEQTTDIYYGHYLAMNTNWSYTRDEYDRDPSRLSPDQLLERNLSKIRNHT